MTLALLTRTADQQKIIAKQIKENIRSDAAVALDIVDDVGRVGSGAYPLAEKAACSIKISIKDWSAEQIARYLRMQEIPVFGYIRTNQFYLNMLAVFPEDRDIIIKTLNHIA
jgi:seryl-tRNA(Sec) selenium transferase